MFLTHTHICEDHSLTQHQAVLVREHVPGIDMQSDDSEG